MRVLIVEDEQAVGMVLQDFLRELDHEAEVVPSVVAVRPWNTPNRMRASPP